MIRLPRFGRKGARTPARIGPPTIRTEGPEEADMIRALTAAAFAGQPHSDGSEPAIVDALRANDNLALSLVAANSRGIVGHAAVSPVTMSEGTTGWYALGPISVEPGLQKLGVGQLLVREAIARLRKGGAKGVLLVGDPVYYKRFGFRTSTSLSVEGPMSDYLQALPLAGKVPEANVSFAPAFDAGSEG